MRLSVTPLITAAIVTSQIAAADLSGNSSLISALAGKADTGDVSALDAVLKATGGYPLTYGPTQVGDGAISGAFSLNGLTPVAHHSYRLAVNFAARENAVGTKIAEVSVRDVVLYYVPVWDTAASYTQGQRVVGDDVAADGVHHIWRCITDTDSMDEAPSTGDGNWVDDGATDQPQGSGAVPDWFVIEPGTAKATTETGWGSYFASTDTTPADGIPDALPAVASVLGVLGWQGVLQSAMYCTVSVDGSMADIGVN